MLMKTLFLVWYRSGRPATGPFVFKPYHYGPCAFELYDTLASLQEERLITTTPHRWGRYYLTEHGRNSEAPVQLPQPEEKRITETAQWAAKQSFSSLLRHVYSEAPEYASCSVVATDVTE